MTPHFRSTRASRASLGALATAVCVVLALPGQVFAQANVNIYSYREPPLVEPLARAFTERTGIKVNIVFARDGLNERMAAEGRNSPADLLLTTDVARLVEAKTMGLTEAIAVSEIAAAVPAHLRDGEGHWLALTLRARVVYASKERVSEAAITYEELADPRWRGRICSRSGQHPYNTALIASMIAKLGEAAAEAWLRGVKSNLAHKPAGGDREQIRDVHAGKCDIAIGNTYYMALMQTNTKSPEQQAWARSVKLLFPNVADRGTHVNISGVALARHAPNRESALALVRYLVSADAQRLYAEVNNEYPVNPAVAPSELVRSWGTLKPDGRPLGELAAHRKRASELVDKVNFDAGPSS
jgi:iron(III) transport system substrate-binding protein